MEFVFVVPRSELFTTDVFPSDLLADGAPHGFVPFGDRVDEATFRTVVAERGFFVERAYAEQERELQQIIPYTVVARSTSAAVDGDGRSGDRIEVLLLARTKRGGEVRLHDKLSIGVGGHVDPVDVAVGPPSDDPATGRTSGGRRTRELAPFGTTRDPLPAATRREVLEEELRVEGSHELRTIGLLNDDTNPVGAVHLGVVQVMTVDGSVRVREVDQLEGSFVTIAELRERLAAGANFETWSALLVPRLARTLTPPVHH